MEKLDISSEEKKELEKRGFFIKNISKGFIYLLLSYNLRLLFYLFTFFGFLLIFSFSVTHLIIGVLIWLGLVSMITIYSQLGMLFFRGIYSYIFMGKIFYNHKGIFAPDYNGYLDNLYKINWIKFGKLNDENLIKLKKQYSGHEFSLIFSILFTVFIAYKVLIPVISELFRRNIGINLFTNFTYFILILISLGVPCIFFIIHKLVGHFHPLYAFGNIGEKIQKLTPTIESQSKLIQSEFQKDQNFAILHSGFEKLSNTFSEIVGLVIKLETVEKKANKGNLFDSEKYINSLRSDIVIPLEELKKFLMKQREELRKSQKELTKVRVGGNDESGNREITSKRSDILIQELDTNIQRLDAMIQKL